MAETENRFLHVRVSSNEEPVIRLDADPAADSVGNIIAGGHDVNGSLLLFTQGATDTTDVSEAAVSITASGGGGNVRFRRADPGWPVSMEIDGTFGKILAGGAPNTSAEIVLRGAAEVGDEDLPPARIRLVARDPVSGNAVVTVGAAETAGVIRLVDENNQLAIRIGTDAAGPTIELGNGIRLEVSELFGPAASIVIGGSGVSGSLSVRSAEGDGDVALNAGLGGSGLGFTRDGQTTMRLEGDTGNIRCGGSDSVDGDLLLFPQNADIDVPNQATVRLDAADGSIRAGADGQAGRIVVRNDDDESTVAIEGQSGRIVLRNADAEDTVIMDGESGDIIFRNADCAEEFDIDPAETVDPGTVLILGPDGLRPCNEAYDKKVVGVISGAGALRPGIVLDRQPDGENRAPVALVGKTYCNVTAERQAIELGDLITTSEVAGFAMKATDPARAFGAILGKALQPLSGGRGRIAVLVALQ